MDERQPDEQPSACLCKKFLSILLALKKDPRSFHGFGSCPNVHLQLCNVLRGIKESFSNLKSGMLCTDDSFLLSSLTIAKMFLEICLLAPNINSVNSVFVNAVEKNTDFFSFCLSPVCHPITVRFLSAEILALSVFVSQRLYPSSNSFEDITLVLDGNSVNLMALLYTIDHMCALAEDHECPCFDEFLNGKKGILRQQNFTRNLISSDLKVQIITLRIYSKALAVINHKMSRKTIFENIDCLLIFITTVHCDTVEKLLWKFLYSLLPFPGEEVNDRNLIMRAANKILNSFQARLDVVKPVKIDVDNDDYDVVFTMAVNTLLKSLLWASKDFVNNAVPFEHVWSIFPAICASFRNPYPEDATSLVSCLMEEDEDLINFLMLHLELHCFVMKESFLSCVGWLSISPWELFLELIWNLSFDFSIFNDWLVSNETHFLRYFVRFLKLTQLQWSKFVEACASKNSLPRFQTALISVSATGTLDGCLSMFIKLRNSISKLHKSGLFPYSPEPLLRHLNAIEGLFEDSNDI